MTDEEVATAKAKYVEFLKKNGLDDEAIKWYFENNPAWMWFPVAG